jgi:hypothetical protein
VFSDEKIPLKIPRVTSCRSEVPPAAAKRKKILTDSEDEIEAANLHSVHREGVAFRTYIEPRPRKEQSRECHGTTVFLSWHAFIFRIACNPTLSFQLYGGDARSSHPGPGVDAETRREGEGEWNRASV